MSSVTHFGDGNRGFEAGVINGSVHTDFHLPPERPETPPSPSSTIPFSRDRDFVERRELSNQIQEKCTVPGSWTALVGLGGVGKSQLAIEYAYRIREQSPKTWVFWVHASNAARFEQSIRDIADTVKIFGRRDPKANIFKLVRDWLHEGKRGRWVLVLDNVDDARLLDTNLDAPGQAGNSVTSRPLRDYLPKSQNGSVLITSRSKEAALQLVENCDVIEIEPMDNGHAVALFTKKLGEPGDSNDVAELMAALEYMPLAIVQASAYISQRAPRCSVREYLEEFRKSDREKTSLLDNEAGHLRRDREAKNSIILTWHISFDHIRQIRPSASDLLSLMSLFDRQGIPEALIRNRDIIEAPNKYKDEARSSRLQWLLPLARLFYRSESRHNTQSSDQNSAQVDEFEDDLVMLRSYSFISIAENKSTFEMHGLVQLATRKWLEVNSQLEKWKQQFIRNLCKEFPNGDHETWVRCQALFPHAKSAAEQEPKETSSLVEWATLLYFAAKYSWKRGDYNSAKKLALKSMRARINLFTQEHEDTLESMEMVGLACYLGREWGEALEIQLEVLETCKRVLGMEHLGTLASMSNLALTYSDRGQWKKAEELQLQAMEFFKRAHGAEHLSTMTCMNNLSLMYMTQGRWNEAKDLQEKASETIKGVLGPEHPSTLTAMNNLAEIYRNLGQWKEAEELFLQVIDTRKTVLGLKHGHTLISKGNLAMLYSHSGRWEEAKELVVEVMETTKTVLGPKHPDVLASKGNLALIYTHNGRWKEAKELVVEVMETRKSSLGPKHPDTLISMANLAEIYRNLGQWKEAEDLLAQVTESFKGQLGPEHPFTLTTIAILTETYKKQNRWKEAKELELQVMETRLRVLGAGHPDTLTSMSNLASTYRNQGQLKEAEELEVQVTQTLKGVLGPEHPFTLTIMNNLAFTWKAQGRDVEAIDLMEQCVQLTEKVLGAEHPDTLSASRALMGWKRERERGERGGEPVAR